MNKENIYQILDDLEGFAENLGSEWMKEAHIGVLEINQSTK
jgi:hypothetical protein